MKPKSMKSIICSRFLACFQEASQGNNSYSSSSFVRSSWETAECHRCVVGAADVTLQGIDFASVHSWADNWQDPTTGFQTNWLQQHDLDGLNTLKMPVNHPFTPTLSSYIFTGPTSFLAIVELSVSLERITGSISGPLSSTIGAIKRQ